MTYELHEVADFVAVTEEGENDGDADTGLKALEWELF